MKKYKQLVESLPSTTVVFAYGNFNPPTTSHEMFVRYVRALANQKRCDHIIYLSSFQDAKKNPLPIDRKYYFLKKIFPGTNFKGSAEPEKAFLKALTDISSRYRTVYVVAPHDMIEQYQHLIDKYVRPLFKSIVVMSAGINNPDTDSSHVIQLAAKGTYDHFKKHIPKSMRDVDAKRLMNDIRDGLGLSPIKNDVRLNTSSLREQYFNGEIYNIGDTVQTVNGQEMEIIKRGTNYLLVKDGNGNTHSKWLEQVVQKDKQ